MNDLRVLVGCILVVFGFLVLCPNGIRLSGPGWMRDGATASVIHSDIVIERIEATIDPEHPEIEAKVRFGLRFLGASQEERFQYANAE